MSETNTKEETNKMFDTDNHLRNVTLRPYRDPAISFTLNTFDSGRRDELGKSILEYQFQGPDGKVIFEGADFSCSPMHAIDSDEAVRALLSFLVLRRGDTDDEYFENHTPEQMEFANEHGEILSMYADDENPWEFDSSN
jgi:hypothetical protein